MEKVLVIQNDYVFYKTGVFFYNNFFIEEIKMIRPEDVIAKYSIEELNETADEYYKQIKNPEFSIGKPFNSLADIDFHLQNIGMLLAGLHLGITMTVLEFGSGTCWLSRYLHQLRCDVICCDVSKTALDIGKTLFKQYPVVGPPPISDPKFLLFDGHRIDLPDESVDRIFCFDSFHHVPNQEDVIKEFYRVLRQGGIVGFNEPGRYHSQSNKSQMEMRDYKVLENDINISDIYSIAQKAGFSDIKIKLPLGRDISIRLYRFLNFLSSKKYEEISKVSSFFLFKGKYVSDSRSHEGLLHTIESEKKEYSASKGKVQIPLKITNRGNSRWLAKNTNDLGLVRIGTHLYDENNKLLDTDYSKHPLKKDVEPFTSFEQIISLYFFNTGKYMLVIDLVSEAVCWFEEMGSETLSLIINVEEVCSTTEIEIDESFYLQSYKSLITTELSHTIEIEKDVFSISVGDRIDLPLKITNTGSRRWYKSTDDVKVVRIGTHLQDENKKLIDYNYSRHQLEEDIEPGTVFEQLISVKFMEPGKYILVVDLVSEYLSWFEEMGSKPLSLTINVE